jgi:hypothetical protein
MPLTMSERQSVTNEMRDRYRRAKRKQKSQILDEFCELTKYNRSYAARKLRSANQTRSYRRVKKALQKTPGRKRIYGSELLAPLIKVWSVLDMACGKRLKAGMGDVIDAMIKYGELDYPPEIIDKLKSMSASTIDRLLAVQKKKMNLKGRSTTKPGTLLKSQIPVRTGTDWDDARPGFVEMDTVAHCGDSTRGQYVVTLDVTDIKTCWSEQRAALNKAQAHVFPEVREIRRRLPFDLLGVDSDGGSEFINNEMYRFCKAENILFTRGRPYKKNDGCHIEQKNWSIVRQTIGYARFETQAHCDVLNMIYDYLRLLTNFFMPSQKLVSKGRDGARIIRRLDTPQTPYRRVLASKHIPQANKDRLTKLFSTLNPAELRREVVKLTSELYHMRDKQTKGRQVK